MRAEPTPLPGPDVADLLARMDRHRRTRRRTVAVSASPVVAIACLLAFAGANGGSAGLDPATTAIPASPTASATATPGADHPAPPPSGTPAATATADPSGDPSAGPEPDPADPADRVDGGGADAPAGPGGRPLAPDETVTYEFQQQSADAAECNQWVGTSIGNLGPATWCTEYPGATTFGSGAAAPLPVEVCHSSHTPTASAHPDGNGRWLRARVVPIGADNNPSDTGPRWDWRRPAPPDAVTFAPGDCARWTIDWHAVDDYGTRLPAGRYRLYVEWLSPDLTYVVNQPVDLTITG
jgi:hypothetical protein